MNCTDIKENRKSNILLNQVLRSGTSIGANIHEANYAAGKADFFMAITYSAFALIPYFATKSRIFSLTFYF